MHVYVCTHVPVCVLICMSVSEGEAGGVLGQEADSLGSNPLVAAQD